MDLVGILQAGAIGLGFLLAYLSYMLLSKEMAFARPRRPILFAIYAFMLFSFCLVILGGVFRALPDWLEYLRRANNCEVLSKALQEAERIAASLAKEKCLATQCVRADGKCGSVRVSSGAIYGNQDATTASDACCAISDKLIPPERWDASDSHTSPSYGGGLPGLKVRVKWICQ